MAWFAGCSTVAEVKKLYRKLALEHHPDRGGDTRTMQEINAQYEQALRELDGSVEVGSDGQEHRYYYNEAHERAIMEKVAELLALDLPEGVEVWIIGKWVWVTGPTYEVRHLLGKNGAGMRWNPNREAWYWKPYEGRTRFNKKASLSDLADYYGAKRFDPEAEKEKKGKGASRGTGRGALVAA